LLDLGELLDRFCTLYFTSIPTRKSQGSRSSDRAGHSTFPILEDENGNAVIVNAARYEILLRNFLIPKALILSDDYWFQ
jgi:hypothetical protein